MFIAGEWVDSSSGETSEVVDPSTEEVVARVPKATVDDAERAIQAARKAFDEGPWGKTTAEDRARYLRRVANAIREHAEEWAHLESRQMGKLYEDSLLDMNDCAHTFDYYAGLAVEQHGQTLEVPGESLSMVVREPVGVTVGITPWNYPILMAAWKLAPSLAAGNVMILKPATVSPITTLELARALEEIGLPEGVFQVVTGSGGEIGDYLVRSPHVDMVAFTGSVEVGKHIMREGAETVKKVGLELGGKSPNVVFEDADFEAAIDGVLIGIFAGTGEVCSAGSRAIVQRSIYDKFVGELVSRAMAIKVGPALESDSEMGPLVSAQQLGTVEKYVQIGLDEGAKLATGGHRIGETGYFFEPTIFVDVDNKMRIAQEEIFGPVLVVIPFETEEDGRQDRQRHGLRTRRRRVDEGRHARDARHQAAARRHHLGQHLSPDLQRGPVGRLQAERHRSRAGHLRPRRVQRAQADQHRPDRQATGRLPARQGEGRDRPQARDRVPSLRARDPRRGQGRRVGQVLQELQVV